MKKIVSFFILYFFVRSIGVSQVNTGLADTLVYSGTRLTYPLVEGWIKEFNKTYPGITIKLLPKTENSENADLKFLAYNLENEKLKANETYVVVSNYAQLPISNSSNPLLDVWSKKGLTEQEFKNLYFKSSKEEDNTPTHHTVKIYTREKPACATKTFASHYESDPKNSRGIGVKGDDRSLVEAVLKDTHGVSYNNLGFIYDLKTRKPIKGISVIPTDINSNGKIEQEESFYSDLDVLIHKLETGNISNITVDKVNIVYKTEPANPSVALFLKWVQTEGQKLNHQYGFLNTNTDTKILSLQRNSSKSSNLK